MARVLLHLPYSHLPPTPHLLAVHSISLLISFHFTCCQPGHTVRFPVGLLFFSPPLIGFSLSQWYSPFQFVIVFPFSSFPSRCFPFTPHSSFPLSSFLVSLLCTNPTLLRPLPTSLRGQPGHTVRLATSYFSWPPLCPFFSFSSLSTFLLYSFPLLPPFSSASPLPSLHCLSRCLPKVALPNVAAPFVAITQSGRLPPCRELLALAPPMIFSHLRAPFLCAAYGSGANYVDGCCGPPATRLSLGTLPTT